MQARLVIFITKQSLTVSHFSLSSCCNTPTKATLTLLFLSQSRLVKICMRASLHSTNCTLTLRNVSILHMRKGNADGAVGIFGKCRARVSYSPAPGSTIKKALCHTCLLGGAVNKYHTSHEKSECRRGRMHFWQMPGTCRLRPCTRTHHKKGLVPHLPGGWGGQQVLYFPWETRSRPFWIPQDSFRYNSWSKIK